MGVLDLLKRKKQIQAKGITITSSSEFEGLEDLEMEGKKVFRKAKVPTWYSRSPFGHPRTDDITILRRLAQMGIVQRCINLILDQVLTADWDIVPVDKEDDSPETQSLILEIKDFLENINGNEGNYMHELRRALTDYFEIGEGVLVKSFDPSVYVDIENQKIVPSTAPPGKLLEIQAYDASQFFVFADYHGKILGHWQFNFVETPPQFFTPRELIIIQDQPTTYRYYGRSRIAQIKEFLEMVFYQMLQMRNYYKKGAVFQGILKTLGLNETEQKKLEKFLTEKFKSMEHKFGVIHGGKDTQIDFIRLMLDVKDLAFLEGLDFVQKFVMSIFGVTPAELGITDAVNKASADQQTQVFRRRTIRTLMNLIEYRTNREIIREFDPEGRIKFVFVQETDPQVEKLEQEIAASKLSNMQITINEWRKEKGMDPVPWGDVPLRVQYMQQRQQQFQESNPNNEKYVEDTPEQQGQENQQEEQTKKKEAVRNGLVETTEKYGLNTSILKSLPGDIDKKLYKILDALSSKLHNSLKKVFSLWRTRVLEIQPSNNLNQLTNQIRNSLKLDELAKEITDSMMEAYEKGLQIDDTMTVNENIFGLQDTRTLEYFRQYPLLLAENIENRIERNLRYEIMEGVARGESIQKIRKRIQRIFNDLEDWEADRIARTETTNATTWGRINQLRSHSHTKWVFYATEDERTCPICREHHLKVYDINDLEYKPPLHPNCRCTVLSTLSFDEGELEQGKSVGWSPTPRQAEIELREGESIVKVLTKKYNHENKSTREIAEELGVTHQTVAKWLKQYGIKKGENDDVIIRTRENGTKYPIKVTGKHVLNIRVGNQVTNFNHEFELVFTGISELKGKVTELSRESIIVMKKRTFKKHSMKPDHFRDPKEFAAIINDPDQIRKLEPINEGKPYEGHTIYFLQNPKGIVILGSSKTGKHFIMTGYYARNENYREYQEEGELVWRKRS